MKGMEATRAGDVFDAIDKVAVFTAASETFSRRNTNASIAETIERFRPVVKDAVDSRFDLRAYLSTVIACPFEGPINPEAAAAWAFVLYDLGIPEIDLGDTIGAATPETVRALLAAVDRRMSDEGATPTITLHFHDTFGRAADCVRTALDMGVRSFDGSVAGLGGCPYASKTLPDGTIQRAPGNISTELLVRTIHDAGHQTNVDLDKLAQAAAFAQEIVAKSRASMASGGAP